MENEGVLKRYSPLFRQYMAPLILGGLGLMFLGGGLIGYWMPKKDKEDILFEAASTSSAEDNLKQVKEQKLIVVDIEGAVERPGVYKLAAESRMQDGLIAAGGLAKDADRGTVAKNLNLAAKLTDGMKVYVPAEGEKPPQSPLSGGGVLGDVSGLVNINSATAGELDGLSGVGKVTAEKIIDNRPYEKIEILVEKKIVGQKVFDQIKDKIVAQ